MAEHINTEPPVSRGYVYQSETSMYRQVLQGHCKGYGIDIGFGGDPISRSAIRVDLHQPYANTGDEPVQLGGDCRDLRWFRDGVLDFVYSSHVLEDFDERETETVLREWTRVLAVGGQLVLLLPDQERYSRYCEATGQPYNEHHSIQHFSLAYVEEVAVRLGNLQCGSKYPELGPYSFGVVFEKIGTSTGTTDEIAELRTRLHSAWAERDDLKFKLNKFERHPVVRWGRKWKASLRAFRGYVRRKLR